MEPQKLVSVLEQVAHYFRCEVGDIHQIKTFTNGKSGSGVVLIEVQKAEKPEKVGNYILKADIRNSDEFLTEIQNTMKLGKVVEGESSILFPEFETFGYTNDMLFYVYGVAGSNLEDADSITLAYEKGQSVLEMISRDMLNRWNSNFSHRIIGLSQLIEEGVGKNRLSPDGRIMQRIQNLIGDSLIPTFSYRGVTYPNPYFYIKNENGPLAKVINSLIGNVHGDLNENNIIIKHNLWDKSYDVYMIDASHYKNNGFLFTDHAYLQLSLLLNKRFAANIYDWCSIAELTLPDAEKTANSELLFTWYIYQGIKAFIKQKQSQNEDSCYIQYFCAQIISGLNWLNKKEMDEKRQALCFMYASIYLRELLNCLTQGEELPTPQGQLILLGTHKEKEIWELLGNFDQSYNKYFLISDCNLDTASEETFISLSSLVWNGIFEVTELVSNPIRNSVFPKFKSAYGLQYKLLPSEVAENYEVAPCWCTIQIPSSGNRRVWYNKNVRGSLENLLKQVMSIKENHPLYLVIDTKNINHRIINEIVTDIQGSSGKSRVRIIILDNQDIDLEEDENTKITNVDFSLSDVANCLSMMYYANREENISLPQRRIVKNEFVQNEIRKVTLTKEEVNFVQMDFEIIHSGLGWNEEADDFGEAFFKGVEATWKDIAVHRDLDRIDYVAKWKQMITEKMQSIGSSTVAACQLYHKAGAGGTTLAKRILWDFHTLYPCLSMKKLDKNTIERLKLIYNKCNLPILITVETSMGSITDVDIGNFRIELMNKGVRALFIYVSRMHNPDSQRYPHRFYLANTPDMNMSVDECKSMYSKYSKFTNEELCLNNLQKLTYSTDVEWRSLRQPFFYGLFTFEKEYQNIDSFVEKGLGILDESMQEFMQMLAFLTIYSQVGLKKIDVENFPGLNLEQKREAVMNPLIVYKSEGYRICHPIIAEKILKQSFDSDNYSSELFYYAKDFIDIMTELYDSESSHLSDVLGGVFTHREYYMDEERKKFSNLIMEFSDDTRKKEIFQYLIDKLPDNPHYYNHKARVYIYPSDYGYAFDFQEAYSLANMAIEKSEIIKTEGSGIHHHLMGKIYAKQCNVIIHSSPFRESVTNLWKKIKPIYEKADIEFSQCMAGKNMGYGLVGKMELISGILCKISAGKKSSINAILQRESGLQKEFIGLTQKMQQLSVEYTTKFDSESNSYNAALIKYKEALGNTRALEKQISFKGMAVRHRIQARRAMAAIELWNNNNRSNSFYSLPSKSIQHIHELMEENINENGENNNHDRIMWLKSYMCLSSFDVLKAYNFLLEWPGGDDEQFVCFYRYVCAFVLYYQRKLSFEDVEMHLKQSERLAQKSYGVSITKTRELVGKSEQGILLIHDSLDTEFGKMNNDEREKYREENCEFFTGQIISVHNSLISVRFSLDNIHSFVAKLPPTESFGGWNEGDQVVFALGFSYSEMRIWNMKTIST